MGPLPVAAVGVLLAAATPPGIPKPPTPAGAADEAEFATELDTSEDDVWLAEDVTCTEDE